MLETIQITLNPHSFVAFLTLAMGISYVFFNPHAPFGIMRLLAALFLVIPIALVGYQLGHGIDLAMGAAIGFATARGVSLPNPVEAIRARYYRWKFQRLQNRQRRHDDRSDFEFGAEEQAKARERTEQARQERARREREKQWKESEKSSSNSYDSNDSSTGGTNSERNQSRGSSSGGYHSRQGSRVNAELVRAFKVLGIDETSSFEEAKRAYRKLCKEYHPDAQAGASESVKKMAEEKMKEVNVAWGFLEKKLK